LKACGIRAKGYVNEYGLVKSSTAYSRELFKKLEILPLYSQYQMKHQLDATLCRFHFCRVTLHVSGASAQNM
jgi:hypothetical protein